MKKTSHQRDLLDLSDRARIWCTNAPGHKPLGNGLGQLIFLISGGPETLYCISVLLRRTQQYSVILSSADYFPVLRLVFTLLIYHCFQSCWETFAQFNLIVNNIYFVGPLLTDGSDFLTLRYNVISKISSRLVGVVLKKGVVSDFSLKKIPS